MPERMVCDICGSKVKVRHGLDLRLDVWCCPRCLGIYKSIHGHYSGRGYSNERCLSILRGVVEKQSGRRKRPDPLSNGFEAPKSSLFYGHPPIQSMLM